MNFACGKPFLLLLLASTSSRTNGFQPTSLLTSIQRNQVTNGSLSKKQKSPKCSSISGSKIESIDTSCRHIMRTNRPSALYASNDEIGEGEDDWRYFRAQLVFNEKQERKQRKKLSNMDDNPNFSLESNHDNTHEDRDQFIMDQFESIGKTEAEDETTRKNKSWIYDCGSNIEKGSILLHHPSPANHGYGLNQQWLHKSIVLILEHEQGHGNGQKTSGILLNRPTDLVLFEESTSRHDLSEKHDHLDIDDIAATTRWDIWFGGNEFGIHTDHPKFFCLHSMNTPQSLELSEEIIPGVHMCSMQDAKRLVKEGFAQTSEFWVFSGFQTWDNSDLEHDLHNGLWHAVSTDANIVRKGLRILNAGARCDGDRTWKILMRLIQQPIQDWDCKNEFCDRMLGEWSTKKLEFDGPPKFAVHDSDDNCSDDASNMDHGALNTIRPGMLVQSSIKENSNSDFLLSNQHFHHSTILILQDDDEMTVGVILNMACGGSRELLMSHAQYEDIVKVPLRFGGPLGGLDCDDDCHAEPLFSLHMSSNLKDANIGNPIGEDINGIWRCSFEELSDAIKSGNAFVEDFAIINGICVWSKEDNNGQPGGGILEEVQNGKFEIVPSNKSEKVWRELSGLDMLTPQTMSKNLRISSEACNLGNRGRGDSYLCDTDEHNLHRQALQHWMEMFLL